MGGAARAEMRGGKVRAASEERRAGAGTAVRRPKPRRPALLGDRRRLVAGGTISSQFRVRDYNV